MPPKKIPSAFSSKTSKVKEIKVKGAKGDKAGQNSPYGTALTHVDSSAPTALIAPDDYEHIYKAASGKNGKVAKGPASPTDGICTVNSEAPTALIAPADYEHIFQAEPEPKMKKKGAKEKAGKSNQNDKKDERIPSDAPTALIQAVAKDDKAAGKQSQVKQAESKVKPAPIEADPSAGPSSSTKKNQDSVPKKTKETSEAKKEQQPSSESSSGCCCVII